MDILVKEGEIIRVINILDCVKTLREQRDNMVQTVVNIANEPVLLDFSLTVKAATLIIISGCGSAISSAKEGKSGFVYNLVKSQ